ncbi:MAG: MFS transporter [Bacteroidota bacterium]
MENSLATNDAYAALRIKDFRWFTSARFILTFAIQMQSVIVGWQIYQITKDALSLGLIGLAEAIPFFLVALYAGHAADSFSRKKIILISSCVYFLCSLLLLGNTMVLSPVLQSYGAMPVYCIIFITGIARGFFFPAQSAFSAQLIPKELFGNASTWNSVTWHTAAVSGPAIGGLIVGFYGFASAYMVVSFFTFLAFIFYALVKSRPLPEKSREENIWESLTAGLKFVFSNQIILSAISLDMFAVFFGGAICVLPVFADQILHIGAKGLGFLRAAPAIGSITMSLILAYNPPFKNAGRNLLMCVFGFGITIIIFAITSNFYAALIILLLSGMFDNVSVVIRGTILQLFTPDDMRGRVSSVNSIFIGSSNELGSFESGLAAKIMGLVPSVIFGGSMTLAVVSAIRKFAPELRRLKL